MELRRVAGEYFEDAEVGLFFFQIFDGAILKIGGGEYLEEGLGDCLGGFKVDLARHADDAAEGRNGVAGKRFFEGLYRRVRAGGAAGRRMFDYRAGAAVLEDGATAEQRVEIQQVVV